MQLIRKNNSLSFEYFAHWKNHTWLLLSINSEVNFYHFITITMNY